MELDKKQQQFARNAKLFRKNAKIILTGGEFHAMMNSHKCERWFRKGGVKTLINTNKLKGKIVENGLSVETLAHQLGLDPGTIYRKLRGESDFTIGEAGRIADILSLDDAELTAIFFAQ